ncbi:MAG TPA: biotin carboxylase N-terminal domain-containing protein, partial [Polyangiaceae bacterium]|nr:biotin carboxylase N-terminal domain-containing protein [Polyangiaceae bacterium]
MTSSFQRIAIVNRGEPAMRLLHAVRELEQEHRTGLRTIALFTEPDRASTFVRDADESICLGEATFVDPRDGQRKSKYLDYEALERALVTSKAQAAWVGWGFVAEHAEFAELCAKLGVVFIGPDAEVMRSVGDKIASKRLAERADVPVAPWSGGPVDSLEDARAHAERLGFPLMIKATAGGGGRGVRRVTSPAELQAAFESARSEALKFFGSDVVFLERAIVGARHVEVQVIADAHGAAWALGVRDCTIQRRNQKVLEEAPSPAIGAGLDRALREAAVRVCRAARYRNAGTVEFLLDEASGAFCFMEMNTRLQVEHPVTEATTGVDLVKLQLHVASGGRLQGSAPPTVGHAIEVRLNAEDPDNGFAPAPGRVEVFEVPTGPGVRVDTGVRQGDDVCPEFDSMIAKIIAHGRDRSEALGRLRRALLDSVVVIRGGMSNKAFLLELLSHPEVVASKVDIGWLDRTWAARTPTSRKGADAALIHAAIEVHDRELALDQARFFATAARGRPQTRSAIGHSVELRHEGQAYELAIRRTGPREYRVEVDGERIDARVEPGGPHQRRLVLGGVRHRIVSVSEGTSHWVEVDGV